MNLSKRTAKFLKLFIIACVCGSVVFGILLLNEAHNLHAFTYGRQNRTSICYQSNLQVKINPRHILPAFVKRIKQENYTTKVFLNQSDSKVTKSVRNESSKESDSLLLKSKAPKELLQLRETTGQPSYTLHAFYYPWYGTPEHDGQYLHWNHPYIPHWNKKEAQKWPNYTHTPPDDIGSNFYPLLGAYSSRDREIIDVHMQMMRYAGIGVTVVSWYPPGDADNQGREPDSIMPLILDGALKYNIKGSFVIPLQTMKEAFYLRYCTSADIKANFESYFLQAFLCQRREAYSNHAVHLVAIHIEPYKGRNSVTMKKNLKYIYEQYGSHAAFYRTSHGDKKNVPLIYIYDSYLVDSKDWAAIFSLDGKESVRNTDLDGIFIGLLVESGHKQHVINSHFDGFYTYFATNQFTYGSTWKMWPQLAQLALTKGLLFIPSVGPGYVDTEVRPWNGANTRKRLYGKYYNEAFANALNINPKIISITSFNEWHEGTQIESAVNKKIGSRRYEDYGSKGPNFYLDLTRTWAEKMMQRH